jgi:hypothetical protein
MGDPIVIFPPSGSGNFWDALVAFFRGTAD